MDTKQENGPEDPMIGTYRYRGAPTALILIGLFFGASMIGTAFEFEVSTLFRIVDVSLVSIGILWLVFRVAWMGIVTDRDGIRVMNPFRTWTYSWGQIDRFSYGPKGLRFPSVQIVLTNGEIRRAEGLIYSYPNPNREMLRIVDELNAKLTLARPGSPPSV